MNDLIRDAVVARVDEAMAEILPEIAERAIKKFDDYVNRSMTALLTRYGDNIPESLKEQPILQPQFQQQVRATINGGLIEEGLAVNVADVWIGQAVDEWAEECGIG